jgi:hypothetical protein
MFIETRARIEQLEISPECFVWNAIDLQGQLLFRRHNVVILFPEIAGGRIRIADETPAGRDNADFAAGLQHANPLLYGRFDLANVLDGTNGKNLVKRIVLDELQVPEIGAILKIGQVGIKIEVFESGVERLSEPISGLRTLGASVDTVQSSLDR